MEAKTIIDLNYVDLALVYGVILLIVALCRHWRTGQEKDLTIASLRMVVQLLAVGYLLHLVFRIESPWPVILILIVMVGFAIQTVSSRVKEKMPRFYRIVSVSIFVGCGLTTFFFCQIVVGLSPWYDPRYLIPLAGMIIGNSMTGASLAAERLASEMKERRDEIETSLCLGATSRLASREIVQGAFRAALIPSINSMAAMGIVFLPGLMTGQILSGTEPILAVKYQIAIMCIISGSVAITSLLIINQGSRVYFSAAEQLLEVQDGGVRRP
ncbi:MAG: iron export ABC transporter permease subunit FetB [Deltaproteobacteria bacterium]|nr:iron export ABC transporter permease subunit FetB [Deltaproteobacteria bacterium]